VTPAAHIASCDDYLASRTGRYEWRCARYAAALERMESTRGLTDAHTVVDVGAGWTELDAYLRTVGRWRGRYFPVDGGLDGVDLNVWTPPRRVEWVVALEIVEHLYQPARLIRACQEAATLGVVISTPNPETTDVLGMDPTHVVPVWRRDLETLGFTVESRSFYGSPDDSLLAWW